MINKHIINLLGKLLEKPKDNNFKGLVKLNSFLKGEKFDPSELIKGTIDDEDLNLVSKTNTV